MQIVGEWLVGNDGVSRPVVRGEVRDGQSQWQLVTFLVDTGADSTVLSPDTLRALKLRSSPPVRPLAGVGGTVETVMVRCVIRLNQPDGADVTFSGEFAGITDFDALDISVLGRDIIGLFALIVDQPSSRVCLLRERHTYEITRR